MKYFDMSLNYLSQNRTIEIVLVITIEITNVRAQQIYTIYLLLNYKMVLSQSHFYSLFLFKPHSYGFEIKRLFAFGKVK